MIEVCAAVPSPTDETERRRAPRRSRPSDATRFPAVAGCGLFRTVAGTHRRVRNAALGRGVELRHDSVPEAEQRLESGDDGLGAFIPFRRIVAAEVGQHGHRHRRVFLFVHRDVPRHGGWFVTRRPSGTGQTSPQGATPGLYWSVTGPPGTASSKLTPRDIT